MKSMAAILGVLGLLIGLGVGSLIWGEEKEEVVYSDYSKLPEGREHTYVMFKKGKDWYVSQATKTDPLIPCVPPIGREANCGPMPCPKDKPNCPPMDLDLWTKYDPNSVVPDVELPICSGR